MATKKKSLGKGLGALIGGMDIDSPSPQKTTSETKPTLSREIKNAVLDLHVDDIIANSEQPRTVFDDEKLTELSESIKSKGLIEPIIVVKKESKYELIAGERRWRASKLAGFETLPALLREDRGEDHLELMLIENIQREDLTVIEEANSYQYLIKNKGMTHDALAESIGKSRSHISNTLRILKLPLEIQTHINSGKMTMGQAKMLVSLKKRDQLNLAEEIITKGLSSREVEKAVKSMGEAPSENPSSLDSSPVPVTEKDPHLLEVESQFREKLKTKVKLSSLRNGVGKVEIEYYDYEDLEILLNKL